MVIWINHDKSQFLMLTAPIFGDVSKLPNSQQSPSLNTETFRARHRDFLRVVVARPDLIVDRRAAPGGEKNLKGTPVQPYIVLLGTENLQGSASNLD